MAKFSFLLIIICTSLFLFRSSIFETNMPLESYSEALEPLTPEEKGIKSNLYKHLNYLSENLGERNMYNYDRLLLAAKYIKSEFSSIGYNTTFQNYEVNGKTVSNIIAEIKGSDNADEIIIVGAHYDTVRGTKGANDNTSGVASLLVLARKLYDIKPSKTLRFVAFVNEEPPFFQTKTMGSLVYAKSLKAEKENVVGMLSLETMGYYTNKKNSQKYPPPLNYFYPDIGNFIAFVSNNNSKEFLLKVVKLFRENTLFPSEGVAAPSIIPGIGWSDHWSFFKMDYPAIMITDTAPFRYPYYHTANDTIDKIDFDSLARIVAGLNRVIENLVKD